MYIFLMFVNFFLLLILYLIYVVFELRINILIHRTI